MQRMAAVELELIARPPRSSPAPAEIPPRHPIAVGPALDPDPRTCHDAATLSGLVSANEPTAYDCRGLHRIRSSAGVSGWRCFATKRRSQRIWGDRNSIGTPGGVAVEDHFIAAIKSLQGPAQ
jgi:hypothetical protein